MTKPSRSAARHAERVLGRPEPEPDPRSSWQQHADRYNAAGDTEQNADTPKETNQ